VGDEPTKSRDHDVAEFTCRIVMDVPVRAREITRESVAEEFTPSDELSWEWAERQARLLRALLGDSKALHRYLIGIAKDDLGALLESAQIEGLPADEEDELFEGLYSVLAGADADFFRWARRVGTLYENMRRVHRSFVTDWKTAELKELYLIGRESR
jgi:hypothetical protein